MGVTITDVADRAGVSAATVSRCLRGVPVREAERIHAAVAALGYRPAFAARSLRSGIHYAIAMVVPDITNPFFAAVARGVELVFRGTPWHLLLANSDGCRAIEHDVLAGLLPRVDGLILVPASDRLGDPSLLGRGRAPVILVDRALETATLGGRDADTVLIDNEGGAALAARHLTDLGHVRIAMISGLLDNTPGRARHDGFLAGLAAAGVAPADGHVEVADFRQQGGYQAMARLLSRPASPTAVFCANNVMTVGALKALMDHQVQVPRDISLIGFDDLDLGALLTPPLTVIDRPAEEQGAIAARLMLRRLSKPDGAPPERITLPTTLLVRGSTAPPRAHAA